MKTKKPFLRWLSVGTLVLFFIISSRPDVYGWGVTGHKTVIGIAQRHLTEKAWQNIEKYISYDLKQDALWMDKHRQGDWAFTDTWHTFCVDGRHNYDPVAPTGDAIKAIRDACWRLSDRSEMTDSAVVFNIRTVIHLIGDMHCPVHILIPGHIGEFSSNLWGREFLPTVGVLRPTYFNGMELISYHQFFDRLPGYIHGQDIDAIVEKIDRCSKREIKKIVKGDVFEIDGHKDFGAALAVWAKDCADMALDIWTYNPTLSSELDPAIMEMATPLVNEYMVRAGYRLARLLNAVFGE